VHNSNDHLSINPSVIQSINPSIYLYIPVHIYMKTYVCVCIYIYIYTYIHIYVRIHINTYIHMYIHTFIYVYIRIYIHIYIYIHKHRETQKFKRKKSTEMRNSSPGKFGIALVPNNSVEIGTCKEREETRESWVKRERDCATKERKRANLCA